MVHDGAYHASHYYNPFALYGMMTTVWELWEQLDRRAPDNVVLPVGHGTNLVGMYRGFVALMKCGLIEKLPRFFAAQAENVAPLAYAFAHNRIVPELIEAKPTLAEGIAINRPVRGAEILRAVRETHGAVIAVGEDENSQRRSYLTRQGIFVEPTNATAVGALEKLKDLTGITIVSLTGSGAQERVADCREEMSTGWSPSSGSYC